MDLFKATSAIVINFPDLNEDSQSTRMKATVYVNAGVSCEYLLMYNE